MFSFSILKKLPRCRPLENPVNLQWQLSDNWVAVEWQLSCHWEVTIRGRTIRWPARQASSQEMFFVQWRPRYSEWPPFAAGKRWQWSLMNIQGSRWAVRRNRFKNASRDSRNEGKNRLSTLAFLHFLPKRVIEHLELWTAPWNSKRFEACCILRFHARFVPKACRVVVLGQRPLALYAPMCTSLCMVVWMCARVCEYASIRSCASVYLCMRVCVYVQK